MDAGTVNKKISQFITKLAVKGSKYSKLAVNELNLMMLIEKKSAKYDELGQVVYKLAKKKTPNIENDNTIIQLIDDIKNLEEEEAKIKKPSKEHKTVKG